MGSDTNVYIMGAYRTSDTEITLRLSEATEYAFIVNVSCTVTDA